MKGYCQTCEGIRKIYVDGKTKKCSFCGSSKLHIKKHKWKAYGNNKKKKYDYDIEPTITGSSKFKHTHKVLKKGTHPPISNGKQKRK